MNREVAKEIIGAEEDAGYELLVVRAHIKDLEAREERLTKLEDALTKISSDGSDFAKQLDDKLKEFQT